MTWTIGSTLIALLVAAPAIAQAKLEDHTAGGGVDLKGVNFHDLNTVVQRLTGKTFLWPGGVDLSIKRIHCGTDTPVIDDPDALFKFYLGILKSLDVALVPVGEEEGKIYKVFQVYAGSRKGWSFHHWAPTEGK